MSAEMEFTLKHLGHSGSKMEDNADVSKPWAVSRLWQKASRWLAAACEHFKWCFSLLTYKPQCASKEASREFKAYRLLFFMLAINWTICFANFIASLPKLETAILASASLAFLMFSMWLQFISMVRAKLKECAAEVLTASHCLQKQYSEVVLIFAAKGRKLLVSEKQYSCWMAIVSDRTNEALNAAEFAGVIASAYFAEVIVSRYDFEFKGVFAKPRTMRDVAKRCLRLP